MLPCAPSALYFCSSPAWIYTGGGISAVDMTDEIPRTPEHTHADVLTLLYTTNQTHIHPPDPHKLTARHADVWAPSTGLGKPLIIVRY